MKKYFAKNSLIVLLLLALTASLGYIAFKQGSFGPSWPHPKTAKENYRLNGNYVNFFRDGMMLTEESYRIIINALMDGRNFALDKEKFTQLSAGVRYRLDPYVQPKNARPGPKDNILVSYVLTNEKGEVIEQSPSAGHTIPAQNLAPAGLKEFIMSQNYGTRAIVEVDGSKGFQGLPTNVKSDTFPVKKPVRFFIFFDKGKKTEPKKAGKKAVSGAKNRK